MKRRLTAIRLDKIAAVNLPCQEHATVAIIKHAPTPLAIAKATFQEALEGNMIAGAVNDAFYQSFDGLWERNDAFRTALTDEFSAGGDGSAASAAYVASVKALVDEAVASARDAGATASDTSPVDKALQSAAAQWLANKSKPKEPLMKISTRAELLSAVSKFDATKTPIADVIAIKKAAVDLNALDALPSEGPLAADQPNDDVAKLRREISILKLAPEARTYFDGLDEAAQTAFLAKSAEDQAATVRDASTDDPILYTTSKGRVIRKSHGQLAADLARDNDELRGDLTKVKGELTGSAIEKKAMAYPRVAKAVAIDMIKSAETVGIDSDAGKAVMASLTAMNKAAGGLFKSIGTTDGGDGGGTEPDQAAVTEFNAEVEKATNGGKVNRADAMSKVRRSNPDLFKRAFPDTATAQEEEPAAA
ncbi:MAG: hypothetical protein ACJ8DZ_14085 [Allosphingosinicella sp.]